MKGNKLNYIYKITNPLNDVYIGQTVRPNQRVYAYSGKNRCTNQRVLQASINLHGWPTHKYEVIFCTDDPFEANDVEIELIAHYKKQQKSLNIERGGKGFDGYKLPGIRISKFTFKGEFIETFQSIVLAGESVGCDPNMIRQSIKFGYYHARGFLWCLESDFKLGFIPKPGKTPIFAEVYQYTFKGEMIGIYKSMADAARKTGVSIGAIKQCVLKSIYTAGGFIFLRNPEDLDWYRRSKKKIIVHDINKQETAIFQSITEVANFLNISYSTVRSRLVTGKYVNGIKVSHYRI